MEAGALWIAHGAARLCARGERRALRVTGRGETVLVVDGRRADACQGPARRTVDAGGAALSVVMPELNSLVNTWAYQSWWSVLVAGANRSPSKD